MQTLILMRSAWLFATNFKRAFLPIKIVCNAIQEVHRMVVLRK